MSPSGPGQRSTDPRIHCAHRTRERQQLDTSLCDPETDYVPGLCVSDVDMVAVL